MARLKSWWWLLLLPLLIVSVGFVAWASTSAAPMPEALAALETDNVVEVTTDPWFIFHLVETVPNAGLILYPGGKVDPRVDRQ